jgi:antitoxin Phd
MPNIKPVSDLRNYNEILKKIHIGEPVFLTKNGRGRFVILDLKEYEKTQAIIKLFSKLGEAEKVIEDGSQWLSEEEINKSLGI